jgi:hypothetical protein
VKLKLKDDAIYEMYREFDLDYDWRIVIERNGVRVWYRLPYEIFMMSAELWEIKQPTEDVAGIYGRATTLFQLEPYSPPVPKPTERVTTNEPTVDPGRHGFGRFVLEVL